MALTTCPECGAQVSSDAKACPKCGKPLQGVGDAVGRAARSDLLPKSWGTLQRAGLGFMAAGLLVFLGASGLESQLPPDSPANPSASVVRLLRVIGAVLFVLGVVVAIVGALRRK
jgi:uncharacterized protein YjeT (DUF2065 family)